MARYALALFITIIGIALMRIDNDDYFAETLIKGVEARLDDTTTEQMKDVAKRTNCTVSFLMSIGRYKDMRVTVDTLNRIDAALVEFGL